MEKNASPNDAGLLDISEADKVVAGEHNNVVLAGTSRSRLTAEGGGVATISVSMPAGSPVAEAKCGIIKSDQVPRYKNTLCIDNGFISSPVNETEMKSFQQCSSDSHHSDSSSPVLQTWKETTNMPILSIRCKNTTAELHKARFGSGGRGRCIKVADSWYTPNEFEAICGRASSKDWKRSIRFGGHSIQTLIDEGALVLHAASCTCGACCDDETAVGPVRLFKPYKRRSRHVERESDSKKCRGAEADNVDESDLHPIQHILLEKEDTWQNLTNGLDLTTDYQLIENPPSSIPSVSDSVSSLKQLDDLAQQMCKVASQLKTYATEVRALVSHQLKHTQEDGTQQLHNSSDAKKCANCNREATAECSLCRSNSYCSTFCQKKDWGSHQIECVRSAAVADPNQHSIILIVDSQQQ